MAQGGHVVEPRKATWTPTWAPTWRVVIGLADDGPTVSGPKLEDWGVLGPIGRRTP